MAATRLIVLHINKGKTVAQCLADRTDYRRRRNTPCFRYGDISRILRIAIIGKSVYNTVK